MGKKRNTNVVEGVREIDLCEEIKEDDSKYGWIGVWRNYIGA